MLTSPHALIADCFLQCGLGMTKGSAAMAHAKVVPLPTAEMSILAVRIEILSSGESSNLYFALKAWRSVMPASSMSVEGHWRKALALFG